MKIRAILKRKIQNNRFLYIIHQMIRRYFEEDVSKASAELSYFLLFSIFPLIMFVNSLLSRVAPSVQSMNFLKEILPANVWAIVQGYLIYLSASNNTVPFIMGMGLTIYLFSRAINSLLRTINRIYHIKDTRSGFRRMFISIIFTAGFMASVFLTLALSILGNVIFNFVVSIVPFAETFRSIVLLVRISLPLIFVFVFFLMLYAMVPAKKLPLKTCIPGAFFSLISWHVLSIAFSFYVEHMSNYSVVYGSLGAIMSLMLWLYFAGIVIILGALLNSILFGIK